MTSLCQPPSKVASSDFLIRAVFLGSMQIGGLVLDPSGSPERPFLDIAAPTATAATTIIHSSVAIDTGHGPANPRRWSGESYPILAVSCLVKYNLA